MCTSPAASRNVPCTVISPNMAGTSARIVVRAGSSRYRPGGGVAEGDAAALGWVMTAVAPWQVSRVGQRKGVGDRYAASVPQLGQTGGQVPGGQGASSCRRARDQAPRALPP